MFLVDLMLGDFLSRMIFSRVVFNDSTLVGTFQIREEPY